MRTSKRLDIRMRRSKILAIIPVASLALILGLSPLAAQPCEAPSVMASFGCPGGVLEIEYAAHDNYDDAIIRILEMPGSALLDEVYFGPLGQGEVIFYTVSLPDGDYAVEGEAVCLGGAGSVTTTAPVTISCPGLVLTTSLGQPYPSTTSEVSISLTQVGERAASLVAEWSGPAFDLSGLTLGAPEGTATFQGAMGTDLVTDLVVTALGPDSATLSCVVTFVSPEFLILLSTLGGSDPTGMTIGSVTISTGAPSGPPQIAIDIPDPFPVGSTWVPIDPWTLVIDIVPPFVVLPAGPSTVTITSEVTTIAAAVSTFTEDLPIDPLPDLYIPSIETFLDSTAPGTTSLSQTITDPAGDRLTVTSDSVFDVGSFVLAGASTGQTVGYWRIDFPSLQNALDGTMVVTSAGGTLLRADLIVDSIHPMALSLLGSLGLPDPTGTAAWVIDFENLGGGGARMFLWDHQVFPLGAPVPVVQELSLVLEPSLGFTLPAAPELAIDSTLTSQLGETEFLSQTIPLGGGGSGEFERGDCNADGGYDIGDAIFTLAALFSGGATPVCADACDANDDGAVDIGDPIYTLAALFSGGSPPDEPRGQCGPDPTADGLPCDANPACP